MLYGVDVRLDRTFGPCGVHRQHRRDAVAVLLGDPQRVLADHEIPADGRMACAIRLPIANGTQSVQRSTPADVRILEIADRSAACLEEQVVVVNSASTLESRAQVIYKDYLTARVSLR